MKEYDIFIPLYYNDGTPIEPAKFQDLQSQLLERFEGLTYFPQPNQGLWKFGNVTYRDEIVIYRVISQNPAGSRDFLAEFKVETGVSATGDSNRRTRRGVTVRSETQ